MKPMKMKPSKLSKKAPNTKGSTGKPRESYSPSKGKKGC
jgi:hypothetical protein